MVSGSDDRGVASQRGDAFGRVAEPVAQHRVGVLAERGRCGVGGRRFAALGVALELALGIVKGGEGATKLIAITVSGAASMEEASIAARTIANSLLVKTAVHGGDPNWGRLIAAAGRSGVTFSLANAQVRIGSLVLFSDGQPHDELAPQAADYLLGKTLDIEVNLGTGGHGTATMYTCDLSAEYVRINAEYRT